MNDGTTTSSPGPTPRHCSAIVIASVPFADPDHVAHAQVLGQLPLERLHLGPEDEAARIERPPRSRDRPPPAPRAAARRCRTEECHGRRRYPVIPPPRTADTPPWPALLYIASLTEPIVDFATNVIGDLGLAGIFILMLLDSACIPTSSEAIMLFAGFEVSDGRFTMLEIVLAGVLGNLVGSWIAWGIGWYGRVELLEKHGKWLHITPKHLAWADRWFERYGGATVFFSRMLPVIRTFISLPAGVARMPFWKFTLLSIAGIIPWVLAFGLVGEAVGDRWDEWQKKPALRRLRDPRGDRRRHHLPAVAPPARARQSRGHTRADESGAGVTHDLGGHRCRSVRPWRSARSRDRRSCSRSRAPATWCSCRALLGWRYRDLDPELRKSFEVALHAGGALALLIGLRREVRRVRALLRPAQPRRRWRCRSRPRRWPRCAFERPIERRLSRAAPGRDRADRGLGGDGARRRRPEERGREQATAAGRARDRRSRRRARWRRACHATAPP